MQTLKLHSRVGADGRLTLQLPAELANTDLEVVLVLQPLPPKTPPTDALGWPVGFFERTFGSLRDVPLSRPDQGEWEERDPIP